MERADADKPHMGLTAWKNSPGGPVRKTDVTIAKNFLTETELRELNRIVNMYLDYAELQAGNRRPMHMADWAKRLDAFLRFNEREVLSHAGKISHELATEHAEAEFERFEAARRRGGAVHPVSDFDKFAEQAKRITKDSGESEIEKKNKSTKKKI